jgi:hypothetical protein
LGKPLLARPPAKTSPQIPHQLGARAHDQPILLHPGDKPVSGLEVQNSAKSSGNHNPAMSIEQERLGFML